MQNAFHGIRLAIRSSFAGVCLGVLVLTGVYAQEESPVRPFNFDKELRDPSRPGELIPALPAVPGLERRDPSPTPRLAEPRRQGVIRFRERIARNEAEDSLRQQFAGTWELVAFDRIAEDGTGSEVPMTGRLHYDLSGNMSAQLMPENAGDDENTRRYYAYFGRWRADEHAGTVTHRVEGSNLRAWVDTELVRHFQFNGGELVLELRDGDRVTSVLVWEPLDGTEAVMMDDTLQ